MFTIELIFSCHQEHNEKLQQLKKDQAAYQAARNKFLQWLELTNEKLRSCSDPSGDLNALEDKISTIKVRINVARPLIRVTFKIILSIYFS